jgi:alkyl sulfatase BDS1-like metallo-beta-lactamase superfamily hydrolase
VVELSNGALTNIAGHRADDADLSITINRSELLPVMMGAVSFDDQIEAGKAKLVGKRQVYEQLKSTLVQFELGFELMPGTRAAKASKPDLNPFEQQPPVLTGE